MNPFKKILERLEKYENNDLIEHDSEQCEHCKRIDCGIGMDCSICVMDKAQEIVQEVAKEYNNGWIPCSERLPKVPKGIDDEECPEFNVTINGAKESTTLKYSWDGTWFDDSGNLYDVIAWKPLPEPYHTKGE